MDMSPDVLTVSYGFVGYESVQRGLEPFEW